MVKTAFKLVAVVVGVVAGFWLLSRAAPDSSIPDREGHPMGEKVVKTEAEWREQLTPEQFRVTRQHGTECAFTGNLWNHKGDGEFVCVCCGQPLFDTQTKFESGTGWPSFYDATDKEAVSTVSDRSFMMTRTEVLCSKCDAHLGHVFPDGPAPTRLRYCINSAALKYVPRAEAAKKGE